MITKEIIQKYAFNKPTVNNFLFGFVVVVSVFLIMIATTTFLENEFLVIGFIGGGVLIGLSLSLTKNIFFPMGVILVYNLAITLQIGQMFGGTPATVIFETVIRSIGDALFIAFVVYWVVIFSQHILATIKKLSTPKDEPVTTTKFIIGSIVAGSLYGIMMVIVTL